MDLLQAIIKGYVVTETVNLSFYFNPNSDKKNVCAHKFDLHILSTEQYYLNLTKVNF